MIQFFIKNLRHVLVGMAIAMQLPVVAQGRKENFDNGWRFHRGIVANAEAVDFDDSVLSLAPASDAGTQARRKAARDGTERRSKHRARTRTAEWCSTWKEHTTRRRCM